MSNVGHAVVIGGSIAGMCAARVLSDVFERVTVLDRDSYPTEVSHRKGVPQSRHPHVLLHGGREQLERLFPDFEKQMLEGGALELDPAKDMATLRPDGWAERSSSPNTLLFSSRILIEAVIRKLSSKHENVRYIENTVVTGLIASDDSDRITGIKLTRPDNEKEILTADLVIDASGRGTRISDWLGELGLPVPHQTVVDADSGYSTRWYQGPTKADWPVQWWWRSLWIEPIIDGAARPEDQYFGLLFPVEGGRWIVTSASWGGNDLARDPESFEVAISKLRTPVLADAIKLAEPISPVYARRAMQNSWRHYENLQTELAGFISIGDATCGFNPVYGQGMTSAAHCAGVLQRCLDGEDPLSASFAAKFFKEQAKFLSVPWMMATSRDRQQAKVVDSDDTGAAPGLTSQFLTRLGTLYLGQIAQAAASDQVVNQLLFDVINLSRHPNALMFDPRVFARVVWARIRQMLTPAKTREERIADYPPSPT